jgi:hypothetical protein
MKPSEKINQRFKEIQKKGGEPIMLTEYWPQFNAILEYLDEAYEEEQNKKFGVPPVMDLVALFREVERQKFEAIDFGRRNVRERMKLLFEQTVGKASTIGVDYLRQELFEKEGL